MKNIDRYLNNVTLRTTDLHASFAGKRIFVAGSTGFYGKWFVAFFEYLKARGVPLEIQGGSRATGWDISKTETYTEFQRSADFIINCAGRADASDAEEIREAHRFGPSFLVDSLAADSTLLQFSSGAAGPSTVYGMAKLAAETQLRMSGKNVKIVRPFATVGPGMNLDAAFAISAFIRRAMAGLPLEVSITPITRSFCHINDMIVQCLHVMANGVDEPYEVGSDDPILIEEAARLISNDVVLVGRPFQTNAGQSRYLANLTGIRDRFNISLDFDSKTSILDTYHWHVANQTSI